MDETTWKITFRCRLSFLQNWFSMILKLIMPHRSGPVLVSFRLFSVIQKVSHIFECYGFLLECRGPWMEPREKWHSGADFLFCEPTRSVWLTMILIGSGVVCCLFVVPSFLQINSNFLHFLDFRFEIWQTPPAPQCATFLDSASTSDHRLARDRPKSAGLDWNMQMRF